MPISDRPAIASSDWAAGHIALVLHDFSIGGSERIAIRLANLWAAAGRKVTILCGTETGPARARVDPAVIVRAVTPAVTRGRFSRIRLGRALAAAVTDVAPDVVVGPGNFHVPVLRAMLSALSRAAPVRAVLSRAAPAVVCKISNPIRRPQRMPLGQAIFGLNFGRGTRRFDGLVAMSSVLADEARHYVGGRDVVCIAEPILADDWTPPPPRARSGTIVCAGRLTAQKDFALALRAFALLGGDWRLVILGDGELRATLEDAARSLGVAERVEFLGHVPDIGPWLAQADVLLCSSRYEGYPAVLIEALAAGVPVVTTPCSPSLDEIMRHPSFGVVAAAEPGQLAGALRTVLAGPQPDGAALADLMNKHRAGPSANAWLSLLDRVVAEKRH